jgi:hypothetical protein
MLPQGRINMSAINMGATNGLIINMGVMHGLIIMRRKGQEGATH